MKRQFQYPCSAPLLSLVLSVSQFLAVAYCQAQEDIGDLALKERFLREAPPAWEAYSEEAKRFQGQLSFKFKMLGKENRVYAENHYEVKMNGKSKLISISRERTTQQKKDYQTSNVFAVNPKYAFGLRREPHSSRWAVSELILGDYSNADITFQHDFEEMKKAFEVLVRLEDNFLLRDVVLAPEFHVIRSRWVVQNEEKLAEIVFKYPHKVGERGNPIQGGTLLLDAQRFWCLRSYNVDRKYPGGHGVGKFQVLELIEGDRSLPVPKHVVFRYETVFDEGSNNTREWAYDFEIGVPGRLPDDGEFTLSAFDLPEPPGIRAQAVPLYVWIAGLGFASLAVAIIVRWRGRRLQKSILTR